MASTASDIGTEDFKLKTRLQIEGLGAYGSKALASFGNLADGARAQRLGWRVLEFWGSCRVEESKGALANEVQLFKHTLQEFRAYPQPLHEGLGFGLSGIKVRSDNP